MKVFACSVFLSLLLASTSTHSQITIVSKSEIVEPSISVEDNYSRISFFARHSLGGLDFFEFDLANNNWLAISSNDDVIGGNIFKAPLGAQSPEIVLPCLSGDGGWTACISGPLLGPICQARMEANIRRLQSMCPPGEVIQIRSVSGCGEVEASGCQPLDPWSSDGDGVDR